MELWRFFKNAPKLTCNEEIEGVAAASIYALPLDAVAQLLCVCYKLDRDALLTGSHENDDPVAFIKPRQVNLLYVLEVN
jgi:hypothetical protein